MRRIFLVFLLATAMVTAAEPSAWGKFYRDQAESLRGLTGVFLLVETLTPLAEQAGLSQGVIFKEIKDRLDAAGIRVMSGRDAQREPGVPVLYVNVNTVHPFPADIFSFSVEVSLMQLASLARRPSVEMAVKTWTTGAVGGCESPSLTNEVLRIAGELTADFVHDFEFANPKDQPRAVP